MACADDGPVGRTAEETHCMPGHLPYACHLTDSQLHPRQRAQCLARGAVGKQGPCSCRPRTSCFPPPQPSAPSAGEQDVPLTTVGIPWITLPVQTIVLRFKTWFQVLPLSLAAQSSPWITPDLGRGSWCGLNSAIDTLYIRLKTHCFHTPVLESKAQ